MKISNLLKRIYAKLNDNSLKDASFDFVTFLYDYYFDFIYGIDTVSWFSIAELAKENKVAEHAVLYQATKVLPLKTLFKKLNLKEDQVFIDIGSGKGRVLLLASELGFKEVRGIEFSSTLCSISEKNIKKYKKKVNTKSNFEIINLDASQYQYKDNETVFFMYNPFDEFILEKVLKNITVSIENNKREVLIIYVNPVHRHFLEKTIKPRKVTSYNIWNVEIVVYNI
ncbi:methyltransferase domain-containing protein [Flavobacteriaceae bacterium S0825]|uniref:class I SAM-dependent methyltransferase n=1 Tax=Gaetbulibacter sp. S0825 TaxID=2720084 RepID=UPI00142FC855|nr:methyltransferase domain-containing protein [Gaetbulibacter sp. S0825]MCK0108690.1 methyltransferase domain-containing protein [Flavobacteriaceae bacterium S0825]NIX64326.1 methyltransferase domain-containing protein [Gaetbulibacter sp. S0825]